MINGFSSYSLMVHGLFVNYDNNNVGFLFIYIYIFTQHEPRLFDLGTSSVS